MPVMVRAAKLATKVRGYKTTTRTRELQTHCLSVAVKQCRLIEYVYAHQLQALLPSLASPVVTAFSACEHNLVHPGIFLDRNGSSRTVQVLARLRYVKGVTLEVPWRPVRALLLRQLFARTQTYESECQGHVGKACHNTLTATSAPWIQQSVNGLWPFSAISSNQRSGPRHRSEIRRCISAAGPMMLQQVVGDALTNLARKLRRYFPAGARLPELHAVRVEQIVLTP